METETKTMGMLKSEYSRRVGIPVSTMRNYMNKLYYAELKEMDYNRCQNYLTPKQVDFLNRKLVITD
ncbi:MAG: hypothetical protein Q8R96_11655 [Bacteroidota bacterium]|nr:hypothetical protein [Bacteroidota bacterium]